MGLVVGFKKGGVHRLPSEDVSLPGKAPSEDDAS